MTSAPTQGTRREATCNAILDATTELIAEKGIEGFTISEVARRGDVNRALIYHYYQNRDNLVTHAIDRLMSRFDTPETQLSGDAVARSARMYIEHPEIGRFVFQLLLSGRPLLRVGERFTNTIAHVELLQRQLAPDSDEDPTFGLVMLGLAQLSWSIARKELASVLGLTVEEADNRFVEELRRVSDISLQSLKPSQSRSDLTG